MHRNSSMSTLLLLTLREIRLEEGIHPGQLAHFTGKTPKEWASIETGQTPLTLQVLTCASRALSLQSSYVMLVAEQMAQVFIQYGWYLQAGHLGKEDDLLPLMNEYFASTGYKALRERPSERISVRATSLGLLWDEPSVIQYCCLPAFKEWVDSGAAPDERPSRTATPLRF